jgi:hypothetical protein
MLFSERVTSDHEITAITCDMDHHDDTPMIQTLIFLVKRPDIAKKVRTLTHACHLPPPDMFGELQSASFDGQSLSSDGRTIDLLRLAIRNMVNVHTLRLCHSHYNVGRVLLNDFFDRRRPGCVPIRRLWLENCDLYFDNLYTDSLDMTRLESLRIRRLKLYHRVIVDDDEGSHLTLARMGLFSTKQDGQGSYYGTWHHSIEQEKQSRMSGNGGLCLVPSFNNGNKFSSTCPGSRIFDEHMYNAIPEVQVLLHHNKELLDTLPSLNEGLFTTGCSTEQREAPFFFQANDVHIGRMLQQSCPNLKHLNLDWISASSHYMTGGGRSRERYTRFVAQLSRLRFPHLISLQYRNTVTRTTSLPPEVYLLHPTRIYFTKTESIHGEQFIEVDFLSFLEHHPNLAALAWPVDYFFPPNNLPGERPFENRVRDVIQNLGAKLETLRLQAGFDSGEEQSRRYNGYHPFGARHRFLCEFIGHMSNISTIKIEVCSHDANIQWLSNTQKGAYTRDEKREIVRGLQRCPLKRIIMIGRAFPLGNCWGEDGEFVSEHEGALFEGQSEPLEAEDEAVIQASRQIVPTRPKQLTEFSPIYGWHRPMLLTIASLFAETVTELKFCGFNGSPVMNRPQGPDKGPDITPGLLYHLKYFHNLRQLILSIYILRGDEAPRKWILHSWNQDPTTETPADSDEMDMDIGQFVPQSMAQSLSSMIYQYLSPIALKRGVKFRASFCVGEDSSEDIFDLDMDINEKGLMRFTGPRTAIHFSRYWSKLTERCYF